MKKLNLLFTLTAQFCLLTVFFSACEKGDNIPGKAYGQITVSSTFSDAAEPLLVVIDGVVKDTLSLEKSTLTRPIISEIGEKKYQLIKLSDQSILYESTLTVQAGKITSPPPFLYDGVTALFDDLTAKPAKDSLLIRFVNLAATLPDVVDLNINVSETGTGTMRAVKTLKGVGKKDFSQFIQLPDPASLIAPEAVQYGAQYMIDISDASTGEVLATNRTITFNAGYPSNGVMSVALKLGARNRINVTTVFERTVAQ